MDQMTIYDGGALSERECIDSWAGPGTYRCAYRFQWSRYGEEVWEERVAFWEWRDRGTFEREMSHMNGRDRFTEVTLVKPDGMFYPFEEGVTYAAHGRAFECIQVTPKTVRLRDTASGETFRRRRFPRGTDRSMGYESVRALGHHEYVNSKNIL